VNWRTGSERAPVGVMRADDFECAGIALGPSFAHEGKGAYCDAQDENGCFSHFKIVSEMQNQEAEVPCFASCSEEDRWFAPECRLEVIHPWLCS